MSSLEIYDSSNSQLSSDEYSHDEDDDGLMDMAVSKQQIQPIKSATKSNDTSPTKTDSTASTTPRKLSEDVDAIAVATKPPASREHTQRQIKQMQRENKANLYFKRRSIKWLNQRFNKKTDYISQLHRALAKHKVLANPEYRPAKRAMEREQEDRQLQQKQLPQQQRRERTPSRSRSHSRSMSPELICLDDTENEDSPEKPNETAAGNLEQQQPPQKLSAKSPPPPFALQLEIQSEAEATPAENGSVLDEFLTIKSAIAAEPVIEEAAGCNTSQQQQQPLKQLQELLAPVLKPEAGLDMVVEETTLKRRRSLTPPAVEPQIEKRTKSLPTEDLDDEVIELTPYPEPAKQPTPIPTPTPTPLTLQQAIVTPPATSLHKPVIRSNVEPLNAFKVGSPYSLSPSSGMEYYTQKKLICQQLREQTHQENLAAISYSLETPSPSIEPMDIGYPTQKQLDVQNVKTNITVAQAAVDFNTFATPYTLQQQQPPQVLQQPPQIQQQPPQVQRQPQLLQQPQQLQPEQQQAPLQQPQQPQEPTRSNQRDSESKQTQTSATGNISSVDLNNSNSDAIFHQRVKDLYIELDAIMTDKVQSVKPELQSYFEEKIRIEADLKTLDKLIQQKEEEHNRLLHLRSVKEELLARMERKERIIIMREVLPSILNKSCSTSELYEIHSMLLNEQNSPMPSKYGITAMEQIMNRVEDGLDDIKLLRSALGLQSKGPQSVELSVPPPPPQRRRDSTPAMRSPLLASRAPNYGRSSTTREDYHDERPEELSKRNRPPSRYQQLINEARQFTGSSADLADASTCRQRQSIDTQERSQTHTLDNNHFDNELPINPLFNSSPVAGRQQRQNSDTNTQVNDLHSFYRAEIERAVNQNNRNTLNSHNKHLSAATNGLELEPNSPCQYCKRFKAMFMCDSCQNQWYCSRECQLHAWDTHWKSCKI